MTGLLLAAAVIAAVTYAALRRPPRLRQPTYADFVFTITCDTQAFSEALGRLMLPAVEDALDQLTEVVAR